MVSDKKFTGLLELIQLYKQNPLEIFFIFAIYQNYILALISLHGFDLQFIKGPLTCKCHMSFMTSVDVYESLHHKIITC